MIYINGKALAKAVVQKATHPASLVALGFAACTAIYTQLMIVVFTLVLSAALFFSHIGDMTIIFAELNSYVDKKRSIAEINDWMNWLKFRLVVLPLQLVLINHLINLAVRPESMENIFKLACVYTVLWSSILAARLSHLNNKLRDLKDPYSKKR